MNEGTLLPYLNHLEKGSHLDSVPRDFKLSLGEVRVRMGSHMDPSPLDTQLVNSRDRIQTWVPGCTFPSVPQSHLALLTTKHTVPGDLL